ncbi:MAG TPA: peroxiredoxin [bacterium]|nr:peroxiredoxin [bacterium]
MTPLAPQTKAPDFPLNRSDASRLSDLQGREYAVVYFYPRDNTPGCTIEAHGFQALYPEFRKLGAEIIGISTQGEKSHANFANKCGLEFPLVPDTSKEITTAYGVLGMMGSASRVTFLVGKDGTIARVWPKVSVKSHPQEVLDAVRGLEGR